MSSYRLIVCQVRDVPRLRRQQGATHIRDGRSIRRIIWDEHDRVDEYATLGRLID